LPVKEKRDQDSAVPCKAVDSGTHSDYNENMIVLHPTGPYNLGLSLDVAQAFSPEKLAGITVLRSAVKLEEVPAVMHIKQTSLDPPMLHVWSPQKVREDLLREAAEWVVLSQLDLSPFYSLSQKHLRLGPIINQLHGLKHLRPATIFEMAVIAVTEQQISLAAAYRIRYRIVEKFGQKIDDLRLFPGPHDLSKASLQELASCGLSSRKAQYIRDFARDVSEGTLNLDSIKSMDNDEARAFIEGQRGFGRWSANYILIRGLGRVDSVPSDDLAIRTILGQYLGNGSRMNAAEVEVALEPFKPFRGLAVFYFLADSRLSKVSKTPR
jgi:DNA-3-methyladenine glycosylase II